MNRFFFLRRGGVRVGLALLAVCALVLPGCGGKKSQMLSGKVLTADGKPVTGGDIKFHPLKAEKGREGPFLGTLSNKGEYTITNLAAGEYKVTVNTESVKSIAAAPPGMAKDMKPPPGMEMKVDPASANMSGAPVYVEIPDKYKDPSSTTLTVTVTGGRESKDLKLD